MNNHVLLVLSVSGGMGLLRALEGAPSSLAVLTKA